QRTGSHQTRAGGFPPPMIPAHPPSTANTLAGKTATASNTAGADDPTNESARNCSTSRTSSGHHPKTTHHPHTHIFGHNPIYRIHDARMGLAPDDPRPKG